MRQLFVPACLCVMTFSNTTGFDLPIDRFSGSSTLDKRVLMREAAASGKARNDRTGNDPQADDTVPAVAEVPNDLTGSADFRPTLEPETIPLPPVPRPVVNRSRAEICDTLAKSAQSNALPIAYFIRLLFQESGFDAGSVSSAGAQGIAQFMPETAATEGLQNPFDPLQAIPASARLLRKLFDQFGNLGLAAAAYNAGPKRIQDWLAKKGALPEETQGYVKTITGRPAETWRVASAHSTELTVPRDAPCKEAVPPAPARTVTASKALGKKSEHRVQIAANSPHGKTASHETKKGRPAGAPARHKAPIQQLAARKHKAAHKNQTVAQR